MVTVPFRFPVPPSRQTETRTQNTRAGHPVTEILAISGPLSLRAELRLKNDRDGIPCTATVVLSPPLTEHGVLRFQSAHAGNPIIETLAFSRPLKQVGLQLGHDRVGSPVTSTFALHKLPTQTATAAWTAEWKTYQSTAVRFRNDYNNFVTSPIACRYDWKAIHGTVLRYRHRSLVRGGWRIMAKNLETNEVRELGFIDVDQSTRSLENISLPNGDYEISVLTSSLFWQDAMDGNVRTISVRPGEEISPLPVIYNLRSSVSFGTRTIQWSASHSKINECLFGIWYSSETPVDTNRTPDATVWYSTSMTEFQTSFVQNAPAWVAVAAMRLDEENQIGKVHELYLDWSSVPPKAPGDVMVFAEPLPAIDSEIMDRAVEEEDLTLVF